MLGSDPCQKEVRLRSKVDCPHDLMIRGALDSATDTEAKKAEPTHIGCPS